MSPTRIRRAAGALSILVPALFITCFTWLQLAFDYPDILRAPTEHILREFHAGGSRLIAAWYSMTLAAILFVPTALLLGETLRGEHEREIGLLPAFGVLAGLVQVLGLIRWPFVVPSLASAYLDPAASPATRQAIEVAFQLIHRYAGMALGEHLGYLFTGAWTLLLCLRMRKSSALHPAWSWIGMVTAAAVLLGILEPISGKVAGSINAVGYTAWALWLAAFGCALLFGPGKPAAR